MTNQHTQDENIAALHHDPPSVGSVVVRSHQRFTDKQRGDMKAMSRQGKSVQQIATAFSATDATIERVLNKTNGRPTETLNVDSATHKWISSFATIHGMTQGEVVSQLIDIAKPKFKSYFHDSGKAKRIRKTKKNRACF